MTGPASPTYDRAYYERRYRSYDAQNPTRKLAFYATLVGDAASVLDVGCAFGRFLRHLGPRRVRMGIDLSEDAVRAGREDVPGACLAVGSSVAIPTARRFDAVCAFDVFEHVPDLDAARAAACARLADGGRLVFVVPVYDGPLGPLVRLLDRDPTHVHKRSRAFWLDWVSRELRVVEWWGVFRYLLPGGRYLHGPTRALRRVAPAVAVVARRDPA